MAFTQAFGYQLYIGMAASATDAHPTNTTGLTELLNCYDAGISVKTQTQDIVDYSSGNGFAKSLATSQDYSLACKINIDPNDEGYKLLKETSMRAVAGDFLKFYRLSPIAGGTTREAHSGIVQVVDFTETIQAGGIASASFTLKGYDDYTYTEAT